MAADIEETVSNNLESYRPYVESCVQVIDLVVFFKEFSDDQKKKFSKTSRSDPVKATRQAFDAIINMTNVSHKYQLLLQALEAAEYPKIVQLLKGILTPVHAEHRQLLQNSAKAIFHRLSVAEILPILYQKKVLNQNDLDELISTERTHSRGAAATDLLFILPNRHQDWFELFLLALIESGQKELAEIIDSETTGKLEAAVALGIQPPIAKSSLQLSIQEIKKQNLSMKKECSAFEKTQSTSMDHNGGHRDAFHTDCMPCKRRKYEGKAIYYCSDCHDYFCCTCEESHRSFGSMIDHNVMLVNVMNEILVCETCQEHVAENFCENHNAFVCLSCQIIHKSCVISNIQKFNEQMLSKVIHSTVDKATLIQNKLGSMEKCYRKERRNLQRTTDMCTCQIFVFFKELRDFLEELKSNTFQKLAQQESIQKSKMDRCITFCIFTCHQIDSQMRSLQSQNISDHKNRMLMETFKMLQYLKQVEKEVDALQKETSSHSFEFVRRECLVNLKSTITDLGETHIKVDGK